MGSELLLRVAYKRLVLICEKWKKDMSRIPTNVSASVSRYSVRAKRVACSQPAAYATPIFEVMVAGSSM